MLQFSAVPAVGRPGQFYIGNPGNSPAAGNTIIFTFGLPAPEWEAGPPMNQWESDIPGLNWESGDAGVTVNE